MGNVHSTALMVKVPHILKAFYDVDILIEDTLLDWDKKVRGVLGPGCGEFHRDLWWDI